MKTKNTLLLAGAVALGFTLTTAKAADFAASPRFQQQLNERKPMAGAPDSAASPRAQHPMNEHKTMVSAARLAASPRLQQQLDERRIVPSADTNPNLVTHDYPGVAAKNPYHRPAPVEIAPLKEKSK